MIRDGRIRCLSQLPAEKSLELGECVMAIPIFIISLPRSGSTLLQRLLEASGECVSYSEPSFLLRFLGNGPLSERKAPYGEYLVERAFQEMDAAFPGYDRCYRESVARLAQSLYDHVAGKTRYFVDKTPRYSLIASELVDVFRNAKFVFLWRNPGAVMASMANTWKEGRWDLAEYRVDLIHGAREMGSALEKAGSRAISVRYEDLVEERDATLIRIGRFLEIGNLIDVAHQELPGKVKGTLGDPIGSHRFKTLHSSVRRDWKSECNNWFRVRLLNQILTHVGFDLWKDAGYTDIELTCGDVPIGFWRGLQDAAAFARSSAIMWAHPGILRSLYGSRIGIAPSLCFR